MCVLLYCTTLWEEELPAAGAATLQEEICCLREQQCIYHAPHTCCLPLTQPEQRW
jgi:hypothetical protein